MTRRNGRAIAYPLAYRGQIIFPHQFAFPACPHIVKRLGPHGNARTPGNAFKLCPQILFRVPVSGNDVFGAGTRLFKAVHERLVDFVE